MFEKSLGGGKQPPRKGAVTCRKAMKWEKKADNQKRKNGNRQARCFDLLAKKQVKGARELDSASSFWQKKKAKK